MDDSVVPLFKSLDSGYLRPVSPQAARVAIDDSVPLKYLVAPLFKKPDSGYLRPVSSRAALVAIDPIRARKIKSASARREQSLPMSHYDPIEKRKAERRVHLERERRKQDSMSARLASEKRKSFLQIAAKSAPKTNQTFRRLSTTDLRQDSGWESKLSKYHAPRQRRNYAVASHCYNVTDHKNEEDFLSSEINSTPAPKPQVEDDDLRCLLNESRQEKVQTSAYARARQAYAKHCAEQVRDYSDTLREQREEASTKYEEQRQSERKNKLRIRAKHKYLARLATLADHRFQHDIHTKALLVRLSKRSDPNDGNLGVKIRRARNKFGTVYHSYLVPAKGRECTPISAFATLPPVLLGPGDDPDQPFIRPPPFEQLKEEEIEDAVVSTKKSNNPLTNLANNTVVVFVPTRPAVVTLS